jgi:glutamate dehydrogenase (NAD(P)+)
MMGWPVPTDDLGPFKVIHVTEPGVGLQAVLVVDNVAIGPSVGGIRMAADVTAEECARLARAMTFKNAAAGLPHGGGKSVIVADPGIPGPEKERLIRGFARAIRDELDYIPGPDMGTNETCMAWIRDEIGRAVGLPASIGGIPLDDIGATGFGIAQVVDVALPHCDFELDGARMVVQGFGAVGKHAARFLGERGARLVAASDSMGGIRNDAGLDIAALTALKDEGRSLGEYPDGDTIGRDDVIDVPCEIWIPAARPDVLNKDNVGRLDAKLVPQGANIPFTEEAEALLAARGVLVVPDFIANAGGVICAAVEYAGGTETQAMATIQEKIRANTTEVLEAVVATDALPREAAVVMAERRVREAMEFRRWHLA